MIRGLNSGLATQIIDRVGSETAYFDMPIDRLRSLNNIPERLKSDDIRQEVRNLAHIEYDFINTHSIKAMYFTDPEYPSRLRECSDGPALLYQLGSCNLEARHTVGIVGTRHATPYGMDITRRIVLDLADRIDELVIVSGLAYGIDIAAHRAALESNIPTVAVSAYPLNSVYPAEHRTDAVRIIQAGGAMVSEYPTSSIVHRNNFLERNRIVAGLSDLLIIVESDSKGGAMVTARLAFEYNREVVAVPGRATDRYSRGCNALIGSERARIYTGVDDILKLMDWLPTKSPGVQLELALETTPEQQIVLNTLNGRQGLTVTEIVAETGLPAARIKDILFDLEMNDMIMGIAGGKYTAI